MVLLVTVHTEFDNNIAMDFHSEWVFYFSDIASDFASGLFLGPAYVALASRQNWR